MLLMLASPWLASCGDDGQEGEDGCSSPTLEPHVSQVPLGVMYPPPAAAADRDPSSRESTPYEWSLRLRSKCSQPVKVSKVCLVGAGNKNGADVQQFTVEGPKPDSISSTFDGIVRITYKRDQPNSGNEVDDVAVVIQSNATNSPTLVVPVCARVVKNGDPRGEVTCTSPVTVAAGQRDDALCK